LQLCDKEGRELFKYTRTRYY